MAAPAALAVAPRSLELLQRYRPVLRYDSRGRYFAQPVGPRLGVPRARRGDRVYGHLAREDGDTWLQYWLFYARNPQGPRFQEDDRWTTPASFHRDRARACGSGPPGRGWQTMLLAALALVAVSGLLLQRRRRLAGR
jgi:hypothetical protein